jgi:hypothetical protein
MQMLYNSDSYVVVVFEDPVEDAALNDDAALSARAEGAPAGLGAGSGRGGYEIVDKFAQKGIYLSGSLAESFKVGVEALVESSPSEEDMDAFIDRYAALMQQRLVLH